MAHNFGKIWLLLYIIFENEGFVSEWNKYIPQSKSKFIFKYSLFLTDSSPK